VVLAAVLLLPGCVTDRHVVLVQRTVVGFDGSVTASDGVPTTALTFGYDRQFMASAALAGGNTPEAMSTISCIDLETTGLSAFRMDERLATGTAATNYAKATDGTSGFFTCFDAPVKPGAGTGTAPATNSAQEK